MDTNVKNVHERENMCMICRMHGGMYGGGGCSCCGGMNNYFLIRILLGLFILGFVFWAGVGVGTLTSDVGGGWQDDGMGGYGGYGRPHKMMMHGDPYGAYFDQIYEVGAPGMPVRGDLPDVPSAGAKVK